MLSLQLALLSCHSLPAYLPVHSPPEEAAAALATQGIPTAPPSSVFSESEGAAFIEDRCFSLVTKDRTLDIEAHSKAQRDAWADALLKVIKGSGKAVTQQTRISVQEELDSITQRQSFFAALVLSGPTLACLPRTSHFADVVFDGETVFKQQKSNKRLIVQLGVRDLPRTDWLSDTDPIVAVFATDPVTKKRVLVDHTEWILDDRSVSAGCRVRFPVGACRFAACSDQTHPAPSF